MFIGFLSLSKTEILTGKPSASSCQYLFVLHSYFGSVPLPVRFAVLLFSGNLNHIGIKGKDIFIIPFL